MEWTPDYISWSIDGNEVRHVNAGDAAVDLMRKEQSLRMNFWTPTFQSWGQGLDAADMPWYVLYDYVEVYKYNEDSKEFELNWRDDFNEFDESRWHKASGGFDANSSVFHPENVSVKAGNLVLKMEPEESVKYKDPVHKEFAPVMYRGDKHGDLRTVRDLHKAEHFDRAHIREFKHSSEGRFWIDNEEPAREEQ